MFENSDFFYFLGCWCHFTGIGQEKTESGERETRFPTDKVRGISYLETAECR